MYIEVYMYCIYSKKPLLPSIPCINNFKNKKKLFSKGLMESTMPQCKQHMSCANGSTNNNRMVYTNIKECLQILDKSKVNTT